MRRSRISYHLFFKIILACCVALIYLQFQLLSSADRNRLVQTLQFKPEEHIPKIVDWERTCNTPKYENPDLRNDGLEVNKTGYLNVLLWENIFGSSINSFLTQPLFPRQPSKFSVASSTFVKPLNRQVYYGQWIVGYVHADVTGEYRFALSSDDSSEFWISTDEHAENVMRVAQVGDGYAPGWTMLGQHAKYVNQVSDPIMLQKCKKYLIQVLHKQAVGEGFVAVSWNRPGSQSFHIITSAYLSPLFQMPKHSLKFIPPAKKEQFESMNAAIERQRENKLSLESPAEYVDVQRLDRKLIQSAIGTCGLLLANTNSTPPATQGTQQLITDMYPEPWAYKIDLNKDMSNDDKVLKALQGKQGILPKKTAKAVVHKFMTLMEEAIPGKFNLESINKVERKKYRDLQERFLLDLTLKDNTRQIKLRSASYVYKSWKEDSLCVPVKLSWNNNILVQVIIIVRKAAHGKWAIRLIDNIDDIYQRTENGKIQITVVHYGPRVQDVEGVLSATHMPRGTIIPHTDTFSYSKAVREALNVIEHDKSISLLVDPYVKLPLDIFDQTRKHCFQGKMAFNPIAFHLLPGTSPGEPEGLWDHRGLAALGMYKQDWRRLLQNTTTGQSDENEGNWNTFERRIESIIEVERMKLNGLFLMSEDEELKMVNNRSKNLDNHRPDDLS